MIAPKQILRDGSPKTWSVMMECENCQAPTKIRYKSYLAIRHKDAYHCLSCATKKNSKDISIRTRALWQTNEYRSKVKRKLKKYRQSDGWEQTKLAIASKLCVYYKNSHTKYLHRRKVVAAMKPLKEQISINSKAMWKNQGIRNQIVKSLQENADMLRFRDDLRRGFND